MLVRYVYKPQSTQKLATMIAHTGPDVNIARHGISHNCQQIHKRVAERVSILRVFTIY